MDVYLEKVMYLRNAHQLRISLAREELLQRETREMPMRIRGRCGSLAEESLRLAMMYQVMDGNSEAARTCLEEASSSIDPLLFHGICAWEECARRGDPLFVEKGRFIASDFFHVFCIFVLLAQWKQAGDLADRVSSSTAIAQNDQPFSAFSFMVMSLLLRDVASVRKAGETLSGWNRKSVEIFLELAGLVELASRHDQSGLDALLQTADKRYRRRSKVNLMNCSNADLGVGGYNSIYFDYATVVICKIARRLGMTVAINTTHVPGYFVNLDSPRPSPAR